MSGKTLRCAIYTRKSSEEGLEQSFNSLHAQREACEAYVTSQAHEGWKALKTAYDDGGFSGGSMDRPALKQLLADIAAGVVDVVVVYKVDRLTRSLFDFAKIVETFDARGVSFVSVTQAFNTTTSMGRLTLNVLLSFAQFEREVTGERIRDKIAASKAKGMWMGGNLPLGYDTKDRALIINPTEAEQVRAIFARYLELGSVYQLCAVLAAGGARSKARIGPDGVPKLGVPFTTGALYHLLENRIYLGDIVHKGNAHPGRHQAIVDTATFDSAQALLAQNRRRRIVHREDRTAAPLKGRLFLGTGEPLSPSFSIGQRGKQHRYYIAATNGVGRREDAAAPRRISAGPREAFVLASLRRLAGSPVTPWDEVERTLLRIEVRGEATHLLLDGGVLAGDEHPELALDGLRARLREGERLLEEPGAEWRLRWVIPLTMRFRGGRTWLLDGAGRNASLHSPPNRILSKALVEAHGHLRRAGLAADGPMALDAQAPTNPHHRKLIRLALLAPDLQRRILIGEAPGGFTLKDLLKAGPPPVVWSEQEAWLTSLGVVSNARLAP